MNTRRRSRGTVRCWVLSLLLIAAQLSVAGNRGLWAHGSSEEVPAVQTDLTFAVRSAGPPEEAADALIVGGWSTADLSALAALDPWPELLQVRINLPEVDVAELPPIVGDYVVHLRDAVVHFLPRYGWSPGRDYVATVNLERAREVLSRSILPDVDVMMTEFHVPSVNVPEDPTVVTAIYPTSNELPENLLRFYIEFSQPMMRGDVYDRVHLIGPDGAPVEAAFLQIDQEFWNRGMQRLTIILDPGRIKRGVGGNAQVGPPLTEGGRYELIVDAGMTDAHRRRLTETARKAFTVVAADDRSPDPTQWRLSSPAADTRDALMVHLDGAIDPLLAQRLIRLEDGSGRPVAATLVFAESERAFGLTPDEEWGSAGYRLAVHPTLEDYAGNRVESVFDMAPGTVAELEATAGQREPVYLDVVVTTATQ